MFSFTYPYLLFLLLLLPVMGWVLKKYRREPSVQMPSIESFDSKTKFKKIWQFTLPYCFYLAALGVLLIALAQPRWGTQRMVMRGEGIDIMLAIDLSGSMDGFDVPKDIITDDQMRSAIMSGKVENRMTIAKNALIHFVELRPNDRFGLIGFSEAAFSFAPPTLDHSLIIELLDSLYAGALHSGATGIASPVISGVRRLSKSKANRRVLVLFTDGKNNIDHSATPLEAATLAKAKDVIIYTVGIGSENAVLLGGYKSAPQIVQMPTEFDEELLKQMAQLTGGRYFYASDQAGLNESMNQINKLEKTSVEQPQITTYKHFAPNLALLALALMLVGFMFETTIKLRLP